MTKYELKQKKERLQKQLEEVNKELERMSKTLLLKDNEKPFSKYTISEMNNLCEISEKAFNWMNENKDKNIYDYNALQSKDNKIPLEK
jgi:hypothetical protein